jgi:NAD(P)-dependent dehydrogenase (short-subunit alcohol dehydrogenase family)
MNDRYLTGKSAWVTGGASGMGRATAIALAKAGADVAIGSLVASQRGAVLADQNCFTPADDALQSTRREIESHGVRALAMALDVCSPDSVSACYRGVVDSFGKIDVLINAAGSSVRKFMVDHPDELWFRMLDVNLTGPYRTIKLCLPGMIERRWGRIVNFASTAANVGYPMHSAYCSAKAGLLGLTRCVALEGAAHGVTCNAINPGFVATEANTASLHMEIAIAKRDISVDDYRAEIMAGLPQKRFLSPDEVGALAAFLCRPEALGIEGQDITIAMGSQW